MYIELHAASAFSFLQGASLPETLVERAATLGYPAMALLDADGVYGAPRFHKAATKAGLRAIIGAELTIEATGGTARTAPHRWRLPVLVASAEGYRNLCRLVTKMKLRAAKGEGALLIEELDGYTAGLVAPARARAPRRAALRRRGSAGSAGRHLWPRPRLRGRAAAPAARRGIGQHRAVAAGAGVSVPVAATNGVRFAAPGDRPLFDVLTCIHHRTTLDAAGRRLARNAERYLKPPEAMAQLFGDWPEALSGNQALAERLEYTMADLGYQFPKYPVPPGETEMSFLRHITEAGARNRYRPYPRQGAHADRPRAGADREAGSRRLLPDRVGHRQLLPPARHPGAGPRLGRQQRRVLQPGHHGRGSDRDGAAVRAVPVGGTRRVARHRSRSAQRRPPRAGDPARLREVRPAGRGDDGQRHHLPRAQRGARGGEGAGARRRSRSIAWPR